MRLLVYSEATVLGGAEIALGNVLEQLRPTIDVTVLARDQAVADALARRRPGIVTAVAPVVHGKLDIRGFLSLRAAMRGCAPDIVQATLSTPVSCRYGVLAALSLRLPTITVENSPVHSAGRVALTLKGISSRFLAAHVAVGSELAAYVESLPLVRDGSVRVQFPAVPDDDVPAASLQMARPIVGTVARLVRGKRVDVLLRAVADLDASVVVIGDGAELEALRATAEQLGLGDRASFLGWRDDARALVAAFDVFALPTEAEGLPVTVLEAMRAGIAVVATDVGSVRDAIDDGETGMLVPAGDTGALRAALERLLADPDARRRLGERARAAASSRFSASAAARWYEQLYDGITGR